MKVQYGEAVKVYDRIWDRSGDKVVSQYQSGQVCRDANISRNFRFDGGTAHIKNLEVRQRGEEGRRERDVKVDVVEIQRANAGEMEDVGEDIRIGEVGVGVHVQIEILEIRHR